MTRDQALPYVSYVIDDALGEHPLSDISPSARLVGWQCGFEPMFVAVQSYLPDTRVDDDDVIEIATDWLVELDWFWLAPSDPDYVI